MNVHRDELKRILKNRKRGVEDKFKIGLFLPGGGMKGVFSGGVMTVLEELGYSDCFDYVYGFSAGAFSGAYLLSGNAAEGTSIYYGDLYGSKFIKPWKLSSAMNLHYLCDDVVKKEKNLDLDKIKKSKTIFKIYVTDAETGELISFSNKENIDLITLLEATSSYPGYSSEVLINGRYYVDGNACHLFPINEAIKDNCTHVLVVGNTKPADINNFAAKVVYFMTLKMTKNFSNGFRAALKKKLANYKKEANIVYKRKHNFGIKINHIDPSISLKSAETNQATLKKYAEHGRIRAKEFFF